MELQEALQVLSGGCQLPVTASTDTSTSFFYLTSKGLIAVTEFTAAGEMLPAPEFQEAFKVVVKSQSGSINRLLKLRRAHMANTRGLIATEHGPITITNKI